MADEITINASMRLTNGNFKNVWTPGTLTVDQATARGGNPGCVNIGTSEEAISFGDLTTPAWIFIQNLDATNYVTWGPTSGGAMVAVGKLLPGEFALYRMAASVTLRMQANTAACNVEIRCYDA